MRGRELEEQRLAELEQQRQIEEKRHLESLALEREKLEAERVRQAERDSAKRQEEARCLRKREMDRKLKEAPPFPRMTETADVELYVSDFEHHMQDLEIPNTQWLTSLRPLLSNWARETLDLINECDRGDYRKVKKTLLTAYCNEKGSLGHRLIVTKRKKGQSSAQYLTQRQRMWRHWTDSWDKEEAGARLNMKFYYTELPYACQNYCRERDPKTLMEIAAMVDKFYSDRDSHFDDPKWSIRKSRSQSPKGAGDTVPAYVPSSSPSTPTTPMQPGAVQKKKRDPNWEANIECYLCRKKGHAVYLCPERPNQCCQCYR